MKRLTVNVFRNTRYANLFHTTAFRQNLKVSQRASDRLKATLEKEDNKNLFLRILVESGGCYGFQYKLQLDDKFNKDGDIFVSETPNAQIVIDEMSLGLVNGAEVDYVENLMGSSFQIVNNPNSDAGCGCGSSFNIKL